MIATTGYAPTQVGTEALQSASAAQLVSDDAAMPCDGMDTATADHGMPCDCCTPSSCDLSACLGTACLLEVPRIAEPIRYAETKAAEDTPAPPSRSLDTPLRPPIA